MSFEAFDKEILSHVGAGVNQSKDVARVMKNKPAKGGKVERSVKDRLQALRSAGYVTYDRSTGWVLTGEPPVTGAVEIETEVSCYVPFLDGDPVINAVGMSEEDVQLNLATTDLNPAEIKRVEIRTGSLCL